ncbi:MAG TPA: hypothetical protein VFG38_06730 [Pseudomonadales bacterium]|nr:hypothetical protein [Pseudomonadales bacterium]
MNDDRHGADDAFVAQVRDVLDRVAPPDEVRTRLAAARRRAVASLDRVVPRAPARWVPVGALATTMLAVFLSVAVQRPAPPAIDVQQLAAVEDMDLLMDLEFVAWLDADNVDAG